MNRLQVLQNPAGRIILGVDYSTRTIDIHAELRWMTVKQRLFYQTSILMYEVLRGNAPDYLNIFSNAHNMYVLRSVLANQIYVPKRTVESFRRNFSYSLN